MRYLYLFCFLLFCSCNSRKTLDCLSQQACKSTGNCCNALSLSKKLYSQAAIIIKEPGSGDTPPAVQPFLLEWNEDIFTW